MSKNHGLKELWSKVVSFIPLEWIKTFKDGVPEGVARRAKTGNIAPVEGKMAYDGGIILL